MFQRGCRLLRASRCFFGGGGGGGTDINQFPGGFRSWGKEQPDIKKGYDFNIGEYNNYVANNPLLNAAQGGALDFWKQLPGMLAQFPGFQKEISGNQQQIQGYQGQLGDLYKQLGGMVPGIEKQISGYQGQLGDILKGLPGQFNQYQNQLGGLFGKIGDLAAPYQQYLTPGGALGTAISKTIDPMLRSGGKPTQDQLNQYIQQGRVSGSQAGTLHDPSALIQDYTSRKTVTDANFNQALQQSGLAEQQKLGASGMLQSIFGQQAGITGQRAGLTQAETGLQSGLLGQQAGLTQLGTQLVSGLLGQQGGLATAGAGLSQMLAGLTGQKAGLLGQQQALQTGGLNQLLSVGNAAVSQFGGLTNPILSYMSGLFGGNQQAAIAQAQVNAQQNAAGDAKTAGGVSAGGSILAAAIPAIIGL